MKKIFAVTFISIFSVVASVDGYAEGYSYGQDRIVQGYGSAAENYRQSWNAANAPAQPVYVAPVSAQGYGFYQNGQTRSSSQQLIWYPTARQRAQSFGQPPYDQGYNPQNVSAYRSPVYNQGTPYVKERYREYYVGVQAGIGNTIGWKGILEHPVTPVFSATLGKRFSPNVRGDAEFMYHTRATLGRNKLSKLDYEQYDLGANVYYDFPVGAALRPFLGFGVWGVKAKVTGTYRGRRKINVSSDIKLAISGAAGVLYRINEAYSLIGMFRTRYIFSKDDLYNLEGLLGFQYHF